MIRAIYQRLCQLLRSLLGQGGSDDPDRPEGDAGGKPDDQDDRPNDDDAKDDSGDEQADSSDGDDQDASEDASPTHSGDESSGIPWPPTDPVPWPDRPADPENTIKVRLYHADPELGLRACRQTAPHLEWALLDAWADRFDLDVDVTVRTEPVPDEHATPEDFDNWIWTEDVQMATDANILVVDSGSGAAGGYSGFINGPDYFEGWGFDPAPADDPTDQGQPPIVPYGAGEPREGVNRVIHEAMHCLGLSHNGRFDEFDEVRWYGEDYLPPLLTGYESHSRYTIRLCAANRRVRPSVQ